MNLFLLVFFHTHYSLRSEGEVMNTPSNFFACSCLGMPEAWKNNHFQAFFFYMPVSLSELLYRPKTQEQCENVLLC